LLLEAEDAVMGGGGAARDEPVQVAAEMLAAIVEGRVRDMLARAAPQILCIPATRRSRSVYRGHAGMIHLVADLHAAHGPYRLEHEDAYAQAGSPDGETLVMVRAQIVRETPGGDVPAQRIVFRVVVQGGLVTSLYASFLDGSGAGTSSADGASAADLSARPPPG
jgi:hypothetical protein